MYCRATKAGVTLQCGVIVMAVAPRHKVYVVAPSGGQACDQTREKGVLATADGGKTLHPLGLLPGSWDGQPPNLPYSKGVGSPVAALLIS